MGEAFTTKEPATITGSVIGTSNIELIEVKRNGYDTIFELKPDAMSASFEFVDDTPRPGYEYSYYMRVIQSDQHMAWSSPIWVSNPGDFVQPEQLSFGIVAIYPNPFNPSTTVRFRLPQRLATTIDIWSVEGKRVTTLVRDREYDLGDHELQWNGLTDSGAPAASGVYFVRIVTVLGTQNARALLLR